MRKAILLLMLLPASLTAQPVIAVPSSQCVWRAGDNAAWAAPNLDDSTWQSYSEWIPNPVQPHIWVRCHADLTALRNTPRLAIQASLQAAYEIYTNGEWIGSAGNLRNGNFRMDSVRSFPAPQSLLAAGPVVVAARITYGYPNFSGDLEPSALSIQAGDKQILDALHAEETLARIRGFLNYIVFFAIIAVLAFVLFSLFLFDRTRRDLLLLSVCCLGLAIIYAARYCAATFASYPAFVDLAVYTAAAGTVVLSRTWFAFVLAGRRVPLLFWIVAGLDMARSAVALFGVILPLNWSLAVAEAIQKSFQASVYANIACAAAPLVAFWPYTKIRRSMVPIATVCMAWGAFMVLFFVAGAASFNGRISHSASVLVSAQLVVTLGVIVLLMSLLLRDQQRTARERAELAGEMASAREVQHYFIPDKLPVTPGFAIQSVYQPSREVGGDFFQVLPDSGDGGTLIVVGDVAGKGLKAGMLSALIVGAIRTAFKFTSDPGIILALLNERLQGRGLVTCLAMKIDGEGKASIANAGHLPPYLNGREMLVEGALPLGAVPNIEFPSTRIQLNAGDAMLFLSDGVVEARNAEGELFGFERTAAISTESAQSIAAEASTFGQEDDITVLTLSYVPVEVAHA